MPAPTATLSVLDSSGRPGPFAIGALDKLVVAMDCANLKPGPHALRVAVTAPGGALYAQVPATIVVGDDGAAHASSTLRVRGSTIESYRQAGLLAAPRERRWHAALRRGLRSHRIGGMQLRLATEWTTAGRRHPPRLTIGHLLHPVSGAQGAAPV